MNAPTNDPRVLPDDAAAALKENLIVLLDLEPAAGQAEVSDDQIISAARDLKLSVAKTTAANESAQAQETAINGIIAESVGALNRDQAKLALDQRRRFSIKHFTGQP
jgi:hypothetical protein